MITFFISSGHEGTHDSLRNLKGTPHTSVQSYDRLLRLRTLPQATYIFTDFDRLNSRELQLAADIYNRIAAAGWQPLNNPARVRQRYALLRRLHQVGINQFGVYRVEAGEMPERYPVFLRNECEHDGPLTELIGDREKLRRAIDDLIAAGHPERHVLIIEYAAEPIRPNLYRKYAMFRIGDRVFPGICFHNETWKTKTGTIGIAGQELYADENAMLRQNPYRDELYEAFEVAHITYGRADYGLMDGRVQIYEINTNPMIRQYGPHPFPIREDSHRLVWQYYLDGLIAIDQNSGRGRVVLSAPARQTWWVWSKAHLKNFQRG